MKKNDLRIVFMGTPEFARESLRALVEGGYRIVGVVTMPDKPAGRHGSVLQASPVKQYALSQRIPVMQPDKLNGETFLRELKAWQADLHIVVAFRMLPEPVWHMPRFGSFNLHASLLPRYRGAAPINWAIINGEKETGVTTFFLTHGMDTGRIIMQRRVPIAGDADAGAVHDRLMTAGAILVLETVDLLLEHDGLVPTIPQEQLVTDGAATLHTAPKIFIDTRRIDWRQPAGKVYDFIRGLSPVPAAWTELVFDDGERIPLKIFQTEILRETHPLHPGSIRANAVDGHLDVAATDGFVRLLSLQTAGKKRMSARDFLNGTRRAFSTVE
ncbi:MAG: methionyl-tRNA formyltransferase [Tannerella sp.]|jgi:methionyl-tRNA formyltransferase|nr:methionyl-tRNA formyltransferase [Tannerella sp.]